MLKRIKIGDLIKQKKAHSQTGPFGTQLKASDYVDDGIPVINVRNIGFGDIRSDSLEFVDEDMAKELKSHKLQKNDIVFGRKGAVERHSLISPKEEGWIQGSDCIRLRFLTAEYNPVFISYFFLTEYHKQWMINLGSFGATMGSLNQEIISKIEIPDISLPIQNNIASILSAYNELIGNNKQRIKLLEEMAEEIYKEWFVRLRFPGYEKCKYFDKVGNEVPQGTEGALPEGWEKVKLKKVIANLESGKRPKGGAENEGIPSVGAENIKGLGNYDFSKEKYVNESFFMKMKNGIIKEKDVLFYKDGADIGRVSMFQNGFPHQKMCVNEHVFIIRSKKYEFQNLLYFFLAMPFTKRHVENINTNAAQPGINKEDLFSIPFVSPEISIVIAFHNIVESFVKEINILSIKNKLLQEIRDLLLPRLISGKLSVEHLFEEKERLSIAAETKPEYK